LLNGAFMFAADFIRQFPYPCNISFVKIASYSGTSSTQAVKVLIGLNEEIRGRHVVILEDIIDTGITMDNILQQLADMAPASISVATLLFKKDAIVKEFPIDYIGMTIPSDFIVGYGLDYDGFGRNYPDIYKIVTI
jgi:hypoxanthine phosphoribosyltransferase